MTSETDLLEAFRKQCWLFGPEDALLLWWYSGEVTRGEVTHHDLLTIYWKVDKELRDA
jgi:hypothetical protein